MQRLLIWVLCALILAGPELPVLAQEFEQVNTTSPQTLENKTLIGPVLSGSLTGTYTLAGTVTITSPTMSNPTITGTVAGGASYTAPTLTGPTITGTIAGAPTITGPTLTSPTITGTVAGGAAYSAPTLNDATMAGTKQFYANIETQDKYADIATAASSCSGGKVLLITKAVTVSTSLTFGSGCVVHMMEGAGSFNFASGGSASITYLVASPFYQIFSGANCTTSSTCVTFTRGRTVYLEWWGGAPGGSATTNHTAGTLAINSLPSGAQGGGVVQFHAGTYDKNNPWYTNSRYLTFRGLGMYSSRIRESGTGNLRHGVSCSGSTGYLGVEDLEISPSTPVTTDSNMKAVNCNDEEGSAGGIDWTGATRAILHVERFKSDGFNFGVYGDGGASVYIHRAECINCTIKVHGLNSNSVSDPVIFQRVEWAIVDKSELECDASTCDHGTYFIQNIHNRVTNTKMSGFVYEAVKFITDATHLTPDPLDWQVENCEFRNNGSDGLMQVVGSYVGESLVWRHNTHFNNGNNQLTDLYVQAHSGATLRKVDASHNYFENIYAQAMKFEADGTSTIEHVDATHTHTKSFSVSSTGTYVAINYGGTGTMRYAVLSGYFDGGTYGKRPHGLMQGGTGFQKVDALGVYEINMATGSTPPSPHVLQSEMGGSATYAPTLQVAYCTQTITGTDANTTEKVLATYDLPANTFFTNNAGVVVEAWGTTAGNGNTKTIRYYFGGSVGLLSNGITTAPNAQPWVIRSAVHRRASGQQSYYGTMLMGNNPQQMVTGAETRTDTSAITIKVTGQNGTAAANDIQLLGFCVYFVPPNPIW